MATEQGLYAQVIMLHRKDLNTAEENKNKTRINSSSRLSLPDQLDFNWIRENFSTHEPYLYNKIFQKSDGTQDTNTFKMFVVPIGNAKKRGENEISLHIDSTMLKYRQNTPNSCCFSSSTLAFESINQMI